MRGVGRLLHWFLQTLMWQPQLSRRMPPMDIPAGMVAQFQQKPEKLLKRLAILEADAQPLTLVNNTLEGGIHPQQHLYFFGHLHWRALKLLSYKERKSTSFINCCRWSFAIRKFSLTAKSGRAGVPTGCQLHSLLGYVIKE